LPGIEVDFLIEASHEWGEEFSNQHK